MTFHIEYYDMNKQTKTNIKRKFKHCSGHQFNKFQPNEQPLLATNH